MASIQPIANERPPAAETFSAFESLFAEIGQGATGLHSGSSDLRVLLTLVATILVIPILWRLLAARD